MDAPDRHHDPGAMRRVPPEVEAWWCTEARRATGTQGERDALARLAPVVQTLSDGFTAARPTASAAYAFPAYGEDARARAAYALWFGAQAWVRTPLPLAHARVVRGWLPPPRPLRLLDVGAAGGSAGLALACWLRGVCGVPAVDLLALDHARAPLLDLERLAREGLAPEVAPRATTAVADVRTFAGLPAAAQGPFDLIVVSFTLNELWPAEETEAPRAWLAGWLERLAPDGLLLVVEPGVKEQALRLVGLAADLVEHGLGHAWGPHHGAGAWRPAPDERTWPHEVRRWRAPASLAQLNQTLWRSVQELTFSYALLGRAAPPSLPPFLPDVEQAYRLASPPKHLRGRRTWLAYDAAGALVTLELQERDATRAERERLEATDRGDLWCIAPPPRPVGALLRLGRARDVKRVLTPEGAVEPFGVG